MKKITIILLSALITLNLFAMEVSQDIRDREHSVQDVITEVNKQEKNENNASTITLQKMFIKGKVSGSVRALYSAYTIQDAPNTYATAIGGQVKYETASFNGISLGAEATTTHDLEFATGDGEKLNSELSSTNGHYTELSQAFINYNYKDINVRAGRQLINTPLADSDDTRMISNTFEAITATYHGEELEFMGGFLSRWQGNDTGLTDNHHWNDMGNSGTYFGGVSYKSSLVDSSLWYYDISKNTDANSATGNVANSSIYADIAVHAAVSQNYAIHAGVQYLSQNESSASAVESDIYGVMGEFIMFEDFSISAAYNNSKKHSGKGSFSGFGGGTQYTNMDSMIIDNITTDRDATAFVSIVTWKIDDFGFMYAYGDFNGDADALGQKEHIIEQNAGFYYKPNKNLTIASIYVKNKDRENSGSNGGNWENVRVLASYSF